MNTRAHVLIQDNAFLGQDDLVLLWMAVSLDNASNVRIERNLFEGVTIDINAFGRTGAIEVSLRDNDFGGQISLWNVTADIRSNRFVDGSLRGGLRDGSVVSDNSFSGRGLSLFANVQGEQALVEDNMLVGAHFEIGSIGHTAGTVEARQNLITGDGDCGVAAYRGAILDGNIITGCAYALYVNPWYGATILPTNLIDGRPTIQIVDAEGLTLDGYDEAVGWLQLVGGRNVTLRNLELPTTAGRVQLWNNTGLVIQDSRFEAGLDITSRGLTMTHVASADTRLTVADEVVVELFDALPSWDGGLAISFMDEGTALVRRSDFSDAWMGLSLGFTGFDEDGNFRWSNVTYIVEEVTIRRNTGTGLVVGGMRSDGSSVTIRNSTFVENGWNVAIQYGTVDARYNWWSSAAGPSKIDGGPGITVLTSPWLTSPP